MLSSGAQLQRKHHCAGIALNGNVAKLHLISLRIILPLCGPCKRWSLTENLQPEASCPNVSQEWRAKHSTLVNFLKRIKFVYIFFFRILNMIFQSYQFFGTENRYCLPSRSLHLYCQAIWKFSKFFKICRSSIFTFSTKPFFHFWK